MFKRFRKNILLKIIKVFLCLNNYSYSMISRLVVNAGNGIHPKHMIMKYHKFFLENVSSNDVVLDIGCGNGFNSYCISKKVKKVIGIDINKENVKYAKENYRSNNIEYIYGDALNYSFGGKFDVVVLSNVLEHIRDRIEFLKKLKGLGNKFLIRVPMIDRSWLAMYKKELGVEYRLDKTHYIEYTFDDFMEEIRKANLRILSNSIQFGEIWAVVKG